MEKACTILGRALRAAKAGLEALSPTTAASSVGDSLAAAYRPLSFPARVAVVDFACNSTAAALNAGRFYSDRFWRVLAQMDELSMLNPDEAGRKLRERVLSPEDLTAASGVELARLLNADYALMGSVKELSPDWGYLQQAALGTDKEAHSARSDIELFTRNQVFQIATVLVDAHSGSTVAHAGFEVLKARPGPGNALGLQAVYLPAPASEAVQAASAMAFCDLKLTLLGSDLWKAPLLLQNDNAASLEGAQMTVGLFSESLDPTVRSFVDAYKKRYAAVPRQVAAQAFDACNMLLDCLKGGAKTREELRQCLSSTKNFNGVSGRASFEGRQDAVKKVSLLRVNGVTKTFEQVLP